MHTTRRQWLSGERSSTVSGSARSTSTWRMTPSRSSSLDLKMLVCHKVSISSFVVVVAVIVVVVFVCLLVFFVCLFVC